MGENKAVVARQVADAAKRRAERKRIALHDALNQVARERGYSDWEVLRQALVAERQNA